MKTKIYYTALVISILLFLWIALSIFNVVAHNNTDGNYAAWNFFAMLFP